jgi:hypothetical protein
LAYIHESSPAAAQQAAPEQIEAELDRITAERDALRAANSFLARRLYETEIHIRNLLGAGEVEARDFHKAAIN